MSVPIHRKVVIILFNTLCIQGGSPMLIEVYMRIVDNVVLINVRHPE
jgi:hypothetical protein